MIKKIISYVYMRIDPIGYARKIGVKVGNKCRIGITAWGSEPYLISIGNEVLISSRVSFINHDGATWVFRNKPEYRGVSKFGQIKIGNRCFIGWGATLLPGAEMGDNSVLAAGAVLSKKIPAGEIWGGVPAKYITKVDEFAEKCKQGKGNVLIGSGNKREIFEEYFLEVKHNGTKI